MFLTEESLGSNCVYIAMCVYIRHIYVDIIDNILHSPDFETRSLRIRNEATIMTTHLAIEEAHGIRPAQNLVQKKSIGRVPIWRSKLRERSAWLFEFRS